MSPCTLASSAAVQQPGPRKDPSVALENLRQPGAHFLLTVLAHSQESFYQGLHTNTSPWSVVLELGLTCGFIVLLQFLYLCRKVCAFISSRLPEPETARLFQLGQLLKAVDFGIRELGLLVGR